MKPIRYEPPDETIEAFHASQATVRGIKGPRGSGKSGACIMEGTQGAGLQNIGEGGVRRSRFLVLRDTYRQLETTTIPSFRKWLGPMSRFSGSYPIRAHTRMPLPDGSRIEMETVFLAMDGENIIENLQSFEASFAWINEARAIQNSAVINMVISSCGRFPSKDEEGCVSDFVVMDTNPSDESHWWYKSAVTERTPSWAFFDQVSPLKYLVDDPVYRPDESLYVPNARATYARIQNKGYRYWIDQIPKASDQFIRTMVMGLYGTLVVGKPVYDKDWHEDIVSAVPLEPNAALPIVMGVDTSGLHPACVFAQSSGGVLRGLAELRAPDCPFDEFVESLVMPIIQTRFRVNPIIAVCDPSNPRSGIGGKRAIQVLQENGIDAVLASSNRLTDRINAVQKFLRGRNTMQLDPNMRLLIEGFRGKYHYKKIESSGLITAYKPVPEKDEYADIHDAWQYLALYFTGGARAQKVIVPNRKVIMV